MSLHCAVLSHWCEVFYAEDKFQSKKAEMFQGKPEGPKTSRLKFHQTGFLIS